MRTGVVWVFVPALVFLVREDSPWACPLMMVMGGAAARCLRSLVQTSDRPAWQGQASGAFALLPAPSGEIWPALAAAVSVEISALAFGRNQVSGCALLLAAAAFLFQWQTSAFGLRLRNRVSASPGFAWAPLCLHRFF